MRQSLKTGLIVLIVAAVATTGIALALDDGDPAGPAPAADAPDPADVRAAAAERIRDRLEPLVTDEVIDSDQADAVAEHLASAWRRPDRVGPRHPGMPPAGLLAEIAGSLGMEPEELRAALAAGSSPAELAEDDGIDPDDLVAGLIDGLRGRLDEAVENGRLTEERADEMLQRAEEHLSEFISNGLPGPFEGPRGGPHRGPHRFPGGGEQPSPGS